MISTKLQHIMCWCLKCKFPLVYSGLMFIFQPEIPLPSLPVKSLLCLAGCCSTKGARAVCGLQFAPVVSLILLICMWLRDKSIACITPFKIVPNHEQNVISRRGSFKSARAGGGCPSVARDLWSCHQWPAVIYQHLNFPSCSLKHARKRPLTLKLN